MEGEGLAAELCLIIVLALWLNHHWLPSRKIIISILCFGVLFINSIGDYRNTVVTDDFTVRVDVLDQVLEIDYFGNLKRRFSEDAPDLINAVYRIEAVDQSLELDYGLGLYNRFIDFYVPRQWIGEESKKALIINIGTRDYGKFNHIPISGTTLTGIATAFSSFWYLGMFIFFLIGRIMNLWYRAAQKDNIVAQIVVILVSYSSIIAFPFSTHTFFLKFIQVFAFLMPVLVWSRIREPLT